MDTSVHLVGAGPGDPAAISLRAIECLKSADVVLYDYLINPALLRWVPASAEVVCLGRHGKGHGRVLSQIEINQKIIHFAGQGKDVVRLKSGDPVIFGRCFEEAQALEEAAIRYEIVPGITSGLAAGSFNEIPLTHRQYSSAVAIITGQMAADWPASPSGKADPYWEQMARFPGTLVLYMGTTTVGYWTRQLLDSGKPAPTPVTIVRRCGYFDQSVIDTTLGEVESVVKGPHPVRPPVIFFIGSEATKRKRNGHYNQLPLRGKTILVTRPAVQNESMQVMLERLGARTIAFPAIELSPVTDPTFLDEAIVGLGNRAFQWILFSSQNGVKFFFQRLATLGLDARIFAGCQIAAVGQKTANQLESKGLIADLVPKIFNSVSVAAAISKTGGQQQILIVEASRSKQGALDSLCKAGHSVTSVVAYQHQDTPSAPDWLRQELDDGKIDWMTTTSRRSAENLQRLIGQSLSSVRLASLSPITS